MNRSKNALLQQRPCRRHKQHPKACSRTRSKFTIRKNTQNRYVFIFNKKTLFPAPERPTCALNHAQGNQTHGLATFSRWPARRLKSSPGTPHQALAVILDIPDRPPVVVYNHYCFPRCGATRDEQVLQIVADMATRREESVIVGDFNQTPDEFTITDLVISVSWRRWILRLGMLMIERDPPGGPS